METRYLKTLVVAMEEGSFSRAAEILHLTQSAVSQRIKFLEERYDRQLLDRSGPVLVATPAGRVVLAKAREILAKERELTEELKRLDSEKRVSLCCTPTYGAAFLPRVLNSFIVQHADLVDLTFVFQQPDEAVKGLLEHRHDLAVIEHCGGRDLSSLVCRELPEDELVFISAPALGVSWPEAPLEELLSHRLYARRDGCSSKRLLKENLETAGRHIGDFQGVVISDDYRFTIEAVQAGSGVSFISRSLVADRLLQGTLRAHHVRGFTHRRLRTLLHHPSREADPILTSLIASIEEVAAPPAEFG